MKLTIRGGRVVDPASGRDEVADVAIAAGRIVKGEVIPSLGFRLMLCRTLPIIKYKC